MIIINNTTSCSGVDNLSIYLCFLFSIFMSNVITQVVLFRSTCFQLSPSGQLDFNCLFPDNLILVVFFRTTILRIRFGSRCHNRYISIDRLTSTDVLQRQDSFLLYLISSFIVSESINCPLNYYLVKRFHDSLHYFFLSLFELYYFNNYLFF